MKKEITNKKKFILPSTGAMGFTVDLMFVLIGSMLYALGVHSFTSPNQIAPGGVTGIATLANAMFNMPIGTVVMILNIPIVIVGFMYVGKRFMIKTLISICAFTLFTDYIFVNLSVFTDDRLLSAIIGGVITGTGLGLILSRNASTGGTDVLVKIILNKMPHLKFGTVVMVFNVLVLLMSIYAYNSIVPSMYALVCLFISSKAIDSVLYGFNICKFVYIITPNADDVSKGIIEEMHRGATIIKSYGAYTKQERPTVMVVIRQSEYSRLKRIVYSIDPSAFMIITTANEVVGRGFESN